MLNPLEEERPILVDKERTRKEKTLASDRVPMLLHADVWRGIDRLAAKHGLTASGLARRAGLDPTAFNPSKRTTREGRSRWPSTESVAKVLAVTAETFGGFVALTGAVGSATEQAAGKFAGRVTIARSIPVISLVRAANEPSFDSAGQPIGKSWGRVTAPAIGERDAFAIEISGHEFDPVYRDGDLVVASRDSELRRGDRIVVGRVDGAIRIVRVGLQDSEGLALEALVPGGQGSFLRNAEIGWTARIVWASQ